MSVDLTKTIDIAGTLSENKKPHQLVIGFALETEKEFEHAADKLDRKNLDFIVVNSLNDTGAGFAHDTNKISVINREKKISHFSLKSKDDVAQDILQIVLNSWSIV